MLKSFDVAIVGGGPAALGELIRLQDQCVSVAVISDSFRGCMTAMGSQRLQSYRGELAILGAPVAMDSFIACSNELHPTGMEYTEYIRACFARLSHTRIIDRVRWVGRENDLFSLGLESGAHHKVLASRVVLATGSKPRSVPLATERVSTTTCFETYQLISDGKTERFVGKDCLLLGSGNSAYQLAAVIAGVARSVTILSDHYPGLFPLESSDPFALRAASAKTLELIAKTSDDRTPQGPLNCRRMRSGAIYLHIYEHLQYQPEDDMLVARLAPIDQQVALVRASTAAALHKRALRNDGGMLTLRLPAAEVELVSAIGVQANVPEICRRGIDQPFPNRWGARLRRRRERSTSARPSTGP